MNSSRGFILSGVSRLACIVGVCMAVSACAPIRPQVSEVTEYDLGVIAMSAQPVMTPVIDGGVLFIPDVQVSGAIEGQSIIYRYTDVQQHEPRSYTQSFWVQPPAEMLRIRAQQFLGQYYLVVLNSELANRLNWTVLLTLEDFSQHFSHEHESAGVVQLRVTLVHNSAIVEQKLFRVERQAISADAVGAVQALAQATDETLEQVLRWLDGVISSRSVAGQTR